MDKYVAVSGGSDSNNGDIGTPWLTITFALSQWSPGMRIFLRTGNYVESIVINSLSGTGYSDGVFISAYQNDQVTVRPITDNHVVDIVSSQFVTLQNIFLRGEALTSKANVRIRATSGSVILKDCSILGTGRVQSPIDRLLAGPIGTHGVLIEGPFVELNNCQVRDNGNSIYEAGIYIASTGNLISTSTITNNTGYGVYKISGDVIIFGCKSYFNGARGVTQFNDLGGITFIGGSDSKIYNSILLDIVRISESDVRFIHNTLQSDLFYNGNNSSFINNFLYAIDQNTGSGNTFSTNFAGPVDFRTLYDALFVPIPGSPLIAAGVDLASEVSGIDYYGHTRIDKLPADALGFDIGAVVTVVDSEIITGSPIELFPCSHFRSIELSNYLTAGHDYEAAANLQAEIVYRFTDVLRRPQHNYMF